MNALLPILIVLLAVANSCSKTQRPGSEVSNRQTTESSPKNSCDFSSYKPFKIGMLQAPVIHLFQPSYPQEAKDRKITGTVVVKVLVNVRSGDVEGACLVEGNEIFQGAATVAARKSKFASNWGGNKYITSRYEYVEGNITYDFVAH